MKSLVLLIFQTLYQQHRITYLKLFLLLIRHMHSLNDIIRYLRNDVENMHQRIISLRETYNSSLSANLNETIRTLTVIATIVLPLTLITGIYGMNFEFMPELTYDFGYFYALGLIAALGGGMVLYFKRKRWI